LAKTEPDIKFSPTNISCTKFIEEKLLFRVDINSSFIERTCEEFPGEKLDIQNIRLPHTTENHENINKSKSVGWVRYLCPSFGKEYLDLWSLFLGNFTFILKCFIYMSPILLFSCLYRIVFDLGR